MVVIPIELIVGDDAGQFPETLASFFEMFSCGLASVGNLSETGVNDLQGLCGLFGRILNVLDDQTNVLEGETGGFLQIKELINY